MPVLIDNIGLCSNIKGHDHFYSHAQLVFHENSLLLCWLFYVFNVHRKHPVQWHWRKRKGTEGMAQGIYPKKIRSRLLKFSVPRKCPWKVSRKCQKVHISNRSSATCHAPEPRKLYVRWRWQNCVKYVLRTTFESLRAQGDGDNGVYFWFYSKRMATFECNVGIVCKCKSVCWNFNVSTWNLTEATCQIGDYFLADGYSWGYLYHRLCTKAAEACQQRPWTFVLIEISPIVTFIISLTNGTRCVHDIGTE